MGRRGLQSMVGKGVGDIDARAICSLRLGEDEEGRDVAVRVGRYGTYLQAGDDGQRVSIKDDVPPDEVTLEHALTLLQGAAEQSGPLGEHPETGEPIYVKTGRYGRLRSVGRSEPGGQGPQALREDGQAEDGQPVAVHGPRQPDAGRGPPGGFRFRGISAAILTPVSRSRCRMDVSAPTFAVARRAAAWSATSSWRP